MKTILFANRKGGVGKSFCSCETVMSLRRSNIRTSFIDLDMQEGALLKTEELPDAEAVILDCPGALTGDLPGLIADADVFCVPTLPSIVDEPSLQLMIDAYKTHGKSGSRLIVIINRFTRWKNSADFLALVNDLIADIENAEVITMMQSESVMQAALADKSVVEFAPKSTAAASVLAMVNQIRVAAGFSKE